MSEPEIPSTPEYHQSEVDYFHPYLQKILERVIEQYYNGQFEVLHHEYIGTIESDLIVKNRSTGRYQLMIEVKRYPNAVNSTRNQSQAQSYIREANPAQLVGENPYYVLTNIEKTELFRYSREKPSVHQQKIKRGPFSAGRFSDDPSNFFIQCVDIFNEILKISINDSGEYVQSNEVLNTLLKRHKDNYPEWHKTFVTTGFEYIRGALSPDSWDEAIRYKSNPERLIAKGQSVDFEKIFKEPHPDSNQPNLWEQDYLSEIYKNGRIHKSGDDLAQISFSIIAEGRENEGLVPTDIELARLLSIVLNECLRGGFDDDEVICDPAAGTGSLLSSFINANPSIQPRQIWANEIEAEMMEPLSLMLGLSFPNLISQDNSPKVTNNDVLTLSKEDFQDISLVILNPPFLSGISSIDKKQSFSARIREVCNRSPKLNVGQIGLEALFVELVLSLIPDGTLVGLVFPKQFLLGRGQEAEILRKYLIEDFNLKCIVNYPRTGLFENVVKATCLLVGQKNVTSERIKSIQLSTSVSDLDLDDFSSGLNQVEDEETESEICYGASCSVIDSQELLNNAEKSWLFVSRTRLEAEDWVKENFNQGFSSVAESNTFTKRRGRIQNLGGTDLIFPDSKKKVWKTLEDVIPSEWLVQAGLRWVDSVDDLIIASNNAPSSVLIADKKSYKEGQSRYTELYSIVEIYKENFGNDSSKGKQSKKEKSIERWIEILETYSTKPTEIGTVLIPRNIRKDARAFIAESRLYASSNVVEVYGGNADKQYLFLSWVLSVFGQLHFEFTGKDQEGARKLELNQVENFLFPDFDSISQEDREELIAITKNTTFLNLFDLSVREIDRKWAELLWPNNSDFKLGQVMELLRNLIYERSPR